MAARKQPSKGGKPDKIWRDAIMRAVKRVQKGDKTQALERLADKLVQEGINGNVVALKEIGDRLDGRPPQAHTGPDGEGPIVVQLVERPHHSDTA